MPAWRHWLASAPVAPFVAHNASFDERFVNAASKRCRLAPLGIPVLCTRRLARRRAPAIGRYSLDHPCAHFGFSNPARHRALADARAGAWVLIELLERARAQGVASLGALLDRQEEKPRRERARGTGRGVARGRSDTGPLRPGEPGW